MKFRLSSEYQVDFTAYAPMHTFRGKTATGIVGEVEVDFDNLTLGAWARADIRKFTTQDKERDQAMQAYMDPEAFPEAAIETTQVKTFHPVDDRHYRITALAVLSFMGIRRQMPVSFSLYRGDTSLTIDIALKWSFQAYGLKAPKLLFLRVRDIVDIKGTGVFNLA